MEGTFNGIPIKEVIALEINSVTGLTVLRALRCPRPPLEKQFVLQSHASVKVSVHEIEGRIIRYDRVVTEDLYKVTIQA